MSLYRMVQAINSVFSAMTHKITTYMSEAKLCATTKSAGNGNMHMSHQRQERCICVIGLRLRTLLRARTLISLEERVIRTHMRTQRGWWGSQSARSSGVNQLRSEANFKALFSSLLPDWSLAENDESMPLIDLRCRWVIIDANDWGVYQEARIRLRSSESLRESILSSHLWHGL